MSSSNLSLSYSGSKSTCTLTNGKACYSRENVRFVVASNGYDFTCGKHQFSWTFGDGANAATTTQDVTHAYNAAGTYSVKVIVANGNQQFTLSGTVTTACTPPGYARLLWNGVQTLCDQQGGLCVSWETITFYFNGYVDSKTLYCGDEEYSWDFGDMSPHALGTVVKHAYSTDTFNEFQGGLTITNSLGSQTTRFRVPVTRTTEGCPLSPPLDRMTQVRGWGAKCAFGNYRSSDTGQVPCDVGESLRFQGTWFEYTKPPNSTGCDTVTWDYGDGSAAEGSLTTHSYTAKGMFPVTFKVSNAYGSLMSGFTMYVGVPCEPPKIKQPKDISVSVGERAVLSAEVTGTAVTVRWYEGAKGDVSKLLGQGPSLETAPIARSTSFWLSAINECGTAVSETITVSVRTRRRAVGH